MNAGAEPLKLNLGCGRNVLAGWVNVDNSPSVLVSRVPGSARLLHSLGAMRRAREEWPRSIVWKDVCRGLPYPDGSAGKVYTSHMLEHLDRRCGESVLRECWRVLRSGGILRVVVPDLAIHARRYLERLDEHGAGRAPHDDFLRNVYGAYLRRKRYGADHRYMYDWPTLADAMRQAGFERLVLQEFRCSLDDEMAMLDNRPGESLHVDALR
jgi:predicted SAM-dependent methyltransferase